jgi:23S rRNA (cytosine1962-C5)-methyltransferase
LVKIDDQRKSKRPAEPKITWIKPALAREFALRGTDAYRIADGEKFRIERFGDCAVISHSAENPPAAVLDEIQRWRAHAGVLIRNHYARRLIINPGKENLPRPLGIVSAGHRAVAHEDGLAYEVDFLSGYSNGLFLDQRGNRGWLRASKVGSVLNLFAYTCSFGVAAAVGGSRTVNVDLSKSALERGRRNFELNRLSLEGHRFLTDDAFDVLPRLARRGQRFDAIILDPPTFSRGRHGRLFRAERDFGRLIELAISCAAAGAVILLSTNSSKVTVSRLRELGSRHSPAPVTFFRSPPLPDIPAGHGAATVWMRIGP